MLSTIMTTTTTAAAANVAVSADSSTQPTATQSDVEFTDDSMNADDADSDSSCSSTDAADDSSDLSSTLSSCADSNDEDAASSSGMNKLELAKIGKYLFELPRGLCENKLIFEEFFSLDTWQLLSDDMQKRLLEFMPKFTHLLSAEEAKLEKQATLSMLLQGELTCFGVAALTHVQANLEAGNYRPDVLALRESIAKSRRREARYLMVEHLSQLAKQMFVARERLLATAYASAPAVALKTTTSHRQKPTSLYADNKLCAVRARKRIHDELKSLQQQLQIDTELSEDELDMPNKTAFAGMDLKLLPTTTTNAAEKCIYNTHFKRKKHLDDEQLMRCSTLAKQPRLSNRSFREQLQQHKRRRMTQPHLPDLDTADIRLRDVCARAQMNFTFKRQTNAGKTQARKPKLKQTEPPALVPIEPERLKQQPMDEVDAKHIKAATVATTVQLDENALITEHSEVFDLMDGEVECQQEEVVTYAAQEETLQTFANNGNAVELAQQKAKTQLTTKAADSALANTTKQHLDVPMKLPKLEPILRVLHNNNNNSNSGNNSNAQSRDKSKLLSTAQAVAANKTSQQPQQSLPAFRTLTAQYSSNNNNNSSNKLNNVLCMPKQQSPVCFEATPPELIQETHACYFSLIRDFFCATPHHRMKFDELKKKIDVWLSNPITALNDWYAQAPSWSTLLASAIGFLAGELPELPEEYVPYIEHKTQLNIYQWIGAGRDSDARLSMLCSYWMQRRAVTVCLLNSKDKTAYETSNNILVRSKSVESEDVNYYDSGVTPPPPAPRCPTNWTVRAATAQEIATFQQQERERFDHPHRAYTYRMHGYESVVGPVKGIYSQTLALTKARGHTMMVGDRPNFVTILTLVRDATARLPNGEGTRSDISELLKCSQYISRDAAENVLQTIVSGALDRMHTEHDPCVRYDPKRKIWIYLHRNRSEEEFERMHQQHQGVSKPKKSSSSRSKKNNNKTNNSNNNNNNNNKELSNLPSNNNNPSNAGNNNTQTLSSSGKFTMPALVPAQPLILSSSAGKTLVTNTPTTQSTQQQQQQLLQAKCPPVPPLKYNIPTAHQKSLLKQAAAANSNNNSSMTTATASNKTNLTIIKNSTQNNNNNNNTTKQYSFSMPQAKTVTAIATAPSATAMSPIFIATPASFQQLNATVAASPTQTVLLQQAATVSPTLSATVGGRKVALNKPIFINQITQNSPKSKSNKQPQQQQCSPNNNQTQQTNLFLPIAAATTAADGTTTARAMPTLIMDNSQTAQGKNIIRLLPANSAGIKSYITSPMLMQNASGTNVKAQSMLVGQRIVSNNTARAQQQQKALANTGISIVSSSVDAAAASTANMPNAGAIVKMTPQAFMAMQQKQQQQQQQQANQQQHILIKQTSPVAVGQQQQRVIVGNTAIVAQSLQANSKNIIVQQLPNQKTNNNNNTSPKLQQQTTTNLSPQQQRLLLQNLKQQQQNAAKAKTATATQQQRQSPIVRTVTNSNATTSTTATATTSPAATTTTRILTSQAGQIITLDNLLQKQAAGTIRIGNSNVASTANIIQLQPQQQQQTQQQQQHQQQTTKQSIAVVSQHGRNVLTIGGMQQKLLNTQAGNAATILTTQTATPKQTQTIQTTSGKQLQGINANKLINKNVAAGGGGGVAATTVTVSAAAAGQIRLMNAINTSGFNLANLQGKQLVFATKPTATASAGNQAMPQLQATEMLLAGGQTLKLAGNQSNVQQLNKVQPTNSQIQTVIMGNQILRVQPLQQTAKVLQHQQRGNMPITSVANSSANAVNLPAKTIVIGSTGQALRLQAASQTTTTAKNVMMTVNAPQQQHNMVATSAAAGTLKTVSSSSAVSNTTNRVLFAVQGAAGQIFLSPQMQNTTTAGAFNLKSLQNMKVVSLTPSSIAKDTNTNLITTKIGSTAQMPQLLLKSQSKSNNSGSSSVS